MRRIAGRASLGMFVFAAILTGCGDDDNTPEDSGTDAAGTGGRGGAAGGDAARADTSGGGGASGGTSDAGPDRSSDGQGGADVMDAGSTDGRSTVDADGSNNADSADRVDGDASSVFDGLEESGPQRNDASDAPTVDAQDGADGVSTDAARDTDASGGDASDALVLDTAEASTCDDSNAATTDFYHPVYGCGHRFNANPGDTDAWITYDAGFHVDVATGLGWAFPAGPRTAAAAAAVCDAFSVMGLVEWRMPTIDDARSLAGGCAATALGGSCALDDPACLTTACGQATPACDACTAGAGPHAGAYCKVDVAICTHFHTSSVCPDCGDAGAQDWIYAPGNGSFLPLSRLSGIPTACVSVVPNGVPVFDGG